MQGWTAWSGHLCARRRHESDDRVRGHRCLLRPLRLGPAPGSAAPPICRRVRDCAIGRRDRGAGHGACRLGSRDRGLRPAGERARFGKSLAVTTGANVASGDRLVVEVGVWSSVGQRESVNDSLGDSFVEVTHFTAADDTEMSIWTAPVPSGGADTIPSSRARRPTWGSRPSSTPDCRRSPASRP